ncbi:MAG: outer membrane lipid asymmetry maintenance protein MlaD [Chthoniobacterales bacterium]|nr:outer membrane lipid asymmetry maintenance protein MlaD [Chthoniobacterales bacterium]
MKQKSLEFSVGIFVLLGLAAVAYMTVQLGSGELLGRDTYLVEARFANAGGMNKGSSVLLAGVPVGRVESVRMDPSDYCAIATLRLLKEVRLPTDTMASIKTSGLIGDKYIALAPGADETEIEEGFRLTLTESAVDLESLIGKMAFGKVEEAQPTETSTEPAP